MGYLLESTTWTSDCNGYGRQNVIPTRSPVLDRNVDDMARGNRTSTILYITLLILLPLSPFLGAEVSKVARGIEQYFI